MMKRGGVLGPSEESVHASGTHIPGRPRVGVRGMRTPAGWEPHELTLMGWPRRPDANALRTQR